MFGLFYPEEALTCIHKLKWRLRQIIVQREGEKTWSLLAREFRKKSIIAGYSSKLVDEILEEYREKMILKSGNQWADDILGN